MKTGSILLALAGVGFGILLVVWLGAGKIAQAVLSIGWAGFAALVALELILIAVLGAAWKLLRPGAKLWVGRLFGMPAHMSLAVSLLRRGRDIVVGVPRLASWQVKEAAALRR